MRVSVFILLTGCSALFQGVPSFTTVFVAITQGEWTLQRVMINCGHPFPDVDEVDLLGNTKSQSPDWVYMQGKMWLSESEFCRAILKDRPQSKKGCPCAQDGLCITVDKKQICNPERYSKLLQTSIWDHPKGGGSTQKNPPQDALRVRWDGEKLLYLDRAEKVGRISHVHWALQTKAGATRCLESSSGINWVFTKTSPTIEMQIPILVDKAVGCAWDGSALHMSLSLYQQTTTIVFGGRMPVLLEWRKQFPGWRGWSEDGWPTVPFESRVQR